MTERILNNQIRNGNFTSSGIVALLSEPTVKEKANGAIFGKPALTYIEECNMERRLLRSLESEISSRPTTWGNVCEEKAFELLGTEYKISSQETFQHPSISFWCGSPDGNKFDKGKTTYDIKCPMTLKSFCQLVQPIYDGLIGIEAMNKIRETHKDGEKYHWQLVSNAILTDSKYAELIVYVPYQSELQDIRDLTSMYDGPIQNRVAWINFATDEDLPYLRTGGYYKNLNVIRYEVSKEDKDLITARVLEAGKLLIEVQ